MPSTHSTPMLTILRRRCVSGSTAALRRSIVEACAPHGPLAGRAFFSDAAVWPAPRGLARFPDGLQHAAAAAPPARTARIEFIDIWRVVAIALYLIVVGQFLAGLYGPNRLDEDVPVQRR